MALLEITSIIRHFHAVHSGWKICCALWSIPLSHL